MHKPATLACSLLLLTGCTTLAPPEGPTHRASYVGDAAAVDVTEVVVSVPHDEQSGALRNLHVAFSAIVNAEQASRAHHSDVQSIIRRSRTRLAAGMVEELTGRGAIPVASLGALRGVLEDNAQAAFDSVFAGWTHAEAFRVEIVVTSIYFTDGSVGCLQPVRRGW